MEQIALAIVTISIMIAVVIGLLLLSFIHFDLQESNRLKKLELKKLGFSQEEIEGK